MLLLLAAGPAASQLMAAAAESEEAPEAKCKRPPVWSLGGGGAMPMRERLGSVVVLALLKRICYMFVMRVFAILKELRAHLWKEGLRGIHYLIVNDNSSASLARYEHLKAQVPPAIPVLQHAPNDTDVWSTLGGTKDDFFIYDRCGRLVAKVGLPLSILAFPYVDEAVRRAYFTLDVCGPCN
uniref:Selenoprotein P N-terminal domain-containing protein n=1 Tax=Petromyzon marinus TaxID=7757 RepID=S4RZM2_PETMA